MPTLTFSKLLFTCLCCALVQSLYSQSKLSNKQEASVWLPTNFKIDGKATEWSNQYQANNYATELRYTIANNSDDLYLIIHADNPAQVVKIVERGVTLTVKKSGADDSDKSFTFPINMDSRSLDLTLNPRPGVFSKNNREGDTTARALDSIMKRNNKILTEKHKWIRVAGVKGVDTLIAIYNNDGITVAEQFDVKKNYTFEMAVKLKLLGISTNELPKIAYQLKVNGAKPIKTAGMPVINGQGIPPEEIEKALADLEARINARGAPSYFDGEYILAKKP